MIDPFFFDRLMHAFTTANATPLNQAAGHVTVDQCTAQAAREVPTCRALQDAEAVVADVLRRERTEQAKPQPHF